MKRIEEELRQSREDLRRAQAVGQIGSWRLDVRENVLTWSDENYRIFGCPVGAALTYETFLAIVHPDDRGFVDAKWQAGLRGEPYDIEHRLLVDGKVKWVREKAFLEYDEAGRLLGGFGITQDITERKMAEEALRRNEADRAAQQERARLARDLHDSVSQAIFAATMKAEALLRSSDALPSHAAETLREVRSLSRGALAQMRMLLWELRGEPLHEIPLPELLRQLVEAAEGRTGADIELHVELTGRLPAEIHGALYRIAQEALSNVARHAHARHAWVRLTGSGSRGRLVVGDDGRGFDLDAVRAGHMGLSSMRERTREAGIDLSLATGDGRGTVVTAEWQTGEPES